MSQIDCLSCKIVISDVTSSFLGNNFIHFTDPFTGLSHTVQYPYFEPGELAKFDNLFWIKCPDTVNGGEHIKRFTIADEDCNIQHSAQGPSSKIWNNSIPNPLGITSTGNGMCAKNATTLIMGSVTMSTGSDWICEVDVSGNIAVVTPLFQTGGFVNGDIVYLPISNTIVATIDLGSGSTFAIHYDMSGNILGQSSFNFAGINPESLFSYEDNNGPRVFISNQNGTIFEFDLSNYTVIPSTVTDPSYSLMSDAASSPGNCSITDKHCYQIGDISDPIDGGAGGIIFALPFTGLNQTPFYYEVAFDDIATGTTPINTITIDDVFPFQPTQPDGTFQCGQKVGSPPVYKPYNPVGAEYGSYAVDLTLPTSIDFGTGDINTQNILSQPATPTFPTHDIAAYLCANYILNGVKGWFLPSLMEFHLLFTNLGPGTPFENDLNLDTNFSKLQNTYWTSSEVNGFIPNPIANITGGASTIGGPDNNASYPFSWGYTSVNPTPPYSVSSFLPGPHVFARCNTLSVRAIRKFECKPPPPPPINPSGVFNYVDNVERNINRLKQAHEHTTAIGFPGGAGSMWSPSPVTAPSAINPSTDPNDWVDLNYEFDATIGFNTFKIRLNLTDAAGNQYTPSDFLDANNPEGYRFKIWTADKIFLGEWHYQNCSIITQGSSSSTSLTKPHIFKNFAQQNNQTWYDSKTFPDSILLKFTNVTLINGDYNIVCYGFTDPEWPQGEVRGRPNQNLPGYNLGINAGYSKPNPLHPLSGYTRSLFPYLPDPKFHYKYSNEYTDGTFQGDTASYAFIHFSCKTADAKATPLPDINIGPNVEYNAKNVVCLKQIFDDIKSNPNQNVLHPTTCGSLGTSLKILPRNWQDYFGSSHPYPYNTNIYGNYVLPGTNITLNLDLSLPGTFPNNNDILLPKHFLWTWHAAYDPPTSSLLTKYDTFLDGLDGGCHHGCVYQIGDEGPAGGIIVATPYMNINNPSLGVVGPVTAPVQGSLYVENPTPYYYELSPENLNGNTDWAQWGSSVPGSFGASPGIDIYNDAFVSPFTYSLLFAPDMTLYDTPSGGSLMSLTGGGSTYRIMEKVGQGKVVHDAMIAVNNAEPTMPVNIPVGNVTVTEANAFQLCENYILNDFDDWFLPNVGEMDFARNYTQPGVLGNTGVLTASVISYNNNTVQSGPTYWTCNSFTGNSMIELDGDGTVNQFPLSASQSLNLIDTGAVFYSDNSAITPSTNQAGWGLIVASDPLNASTVVDTPLDQNFKTAYERSFPANVRAMRRFICPTTSLVGSEKHTWSFCGYKNVFGQIGFFSTPWVSNAFYDQGPVVMDHLGSIVNLDGDDFVDDVVNTLGSGFLSVGQVLRVSFSPPLPPQFGIQGGVEELYFNYEGFLPWDEKFLVTGLLATPVNTVTYALFPNCGSATGTAIVDPNDTSTARLTAPEVQVTNITQRNGVRSTIIRERNNQITRRTDDNQTY